MRKNATFYCVFYVRGVRCVRRIILRFMVNYFLFINNKSI